MKLSQILIKFNSNKIMILFLNHNKLIINMKTLLITLQTKYNKMIKMMIFSKFCNILLINSKK